MHPHRSSKLLDTINNLPRVTEDTNSLHKLQVAMVTNNHNNPSSLMAINSRHLRDMQTIPSNIIDL